MSFIRTAIGGYRNFLDFSGRANRTQFWSFYLSVLLLTAAGQALASISSSLALNSPSGAIVPLVIGWVAIPLLLIAALSSLQVLAMAVRRLHDTNHRGWWVLLPFSGGVALTFAAVVVIAALASALDAAAENLGAADSADLSSGELSILPLIGLGLAVLYAIFSQVYFLYLLLKRGDEGKNRFGERP